MGSSDPFSRGKQLNITVIIVSIATQRPLDSCSLVLLASPEPIAPVILSFSRCKQIIVTTVYSADSHDSPSGLT
jgi:hypothetical protein